MIHYGFYIAKICRDWQQLFRVYLVGGHLLKVLRKMKLQRLFYKLSFFARVVKAW